MDGSTIDFLPDDRAPDDDTTEIEVDELVSGTIDGNDLHIRIRDDGTMLLFRRVADR